MRKADLTKALVLTDMVHAGLWTIKEQLETSQGRIVNKTEIEAMLSLLRTVIDELDVDGTFVKGHVK